MTSKVSTTCVSIFYLMNHQSCQMRNASLHQHHFAPRIVGKGGILEAFGVGAVCCNWASLQYLIFIGRSQESRVVEAFADWQRGTCTFLTTLSLSAIATNGKIAGGGAYYLCLGMCLVIFSFRVQLVQRCYHVCVFRKLLNEMTLFFYAEDLSLFGSCVGGWSWSLLLHGHWAGMRHITWNDPCTFMQ